jgi:hypothetical protein
MTKASLVILQQEPYMVAEKTSGERLLLWFVMYLEQPRAFFVNMQNNLVSLEVEVEAFFFRGQGTLLDGELVKDIGSKQQKYLVFDAVVVGGQSMRERNLLTRLAKIKQMLVDTSLTLPDSIEVQPKEMFFIHDISQMLRKRETLDHACDGAIFTPINCGIQTGRHWHIFKWKEHPTVDLLTRLGEDGLGLELLTLTTQNGTQTVLCTSAPAVQVQGRFNAPAWDSLPLDVQRQLQSYHRDGSAKGVVLEFYVRPELKKTGKLSKRQFPLRYFGSREDKGQIPNHEETVAGVMKEVREDLQLCTIVDAVRKMSSRDKPMQPRELRDRRMPTGTEISTSAAKARLTRKRKRDAKAALVRITDDVQVEMKVSAGGHVNVTIASLIPAGLQPVLPSSPPPVMMEIC